MTLYELIKQVSAILTSETDSFFDYVVNTSDDDGGFLRTCYCYKSHPLQDRKIADLEKTAVCFYAPFTEHYTDDGEDTLVKLQLDYASRREFDRKDFIDWSRDVGFPVAYVFDLINKTYRVEDHRGEILW